MPFWFHNSIYVSVHMSIHISAHMSRHTFTHMSAHTSIQMYIHSALTRVYTCVSRPYRLRMPMHACHICLYMSAIYADTCVRYCQYMSAIYATTCLPSYATTCLPSYATTCLPSYAYCFRSSLGRRLRFSFVPNMPPFCLFSTADVMAIMP